MGIGRILGAAAPIAAGYFGGPAMAGFTGGATSGAIAAGALTGAGIAALTGQDLLSGTVMGGLGGLGGGSLSNAVDAATKAKLAVTTPGTTTAGINTGLQNVASANLAQAGLPQNLGMMSSPSALGAYQPIAGLQGAVAPNMGFVNKPPVGPGVGMTAKQATSGLPTGGGYTFKDFEKAALPSPSTDISLSDVAGQLGKNPETGELNPTLGYGKMALTASGPLMAAFEPEVQTFDEVRGDKYNKYATLNLDDIDTGIGDALKRDTGLRLLAEGGEVESGGFSEAELGYTSEGFKPTTGLGEGETPGIDAYAAGYNVPPGTELTAEGKYIYPMIPSYYYSAYPRRAFEPLPTGGLDSLQRKAKGMAEGGEITDDMRSSYGVTPQYRNVGYGMGARTQERVPVMGVVDVGGKFVSNPKGDITDIQFEEKYLQNQVDAEKNQNQQSGGMGPQFGPGVPAQIPEAAQNALTNLAGGIASAQRSQAANQIDRLGGLADGGYLGGGFMGDGMSDSIPARINDAQEARLSDGEFVVPADVVSHLGNGSSEAGAKRLYSMMDKVRRARTGTKQQGKEINPERYMPA